MNVIEEIDHPTLQNHKIQFGISSWTKDEAEENKTESIRRAVYNEDGIFSPHGSSEIPMEDMPLLIRECIIRNKISINDMADILDAISLSIRSR